MKTKLLSSVPQFFMAFLLLAAAQVSAQSLTILAPKPADNNNLCSEPPCKNAWDKVCAGANGNFNQYFANVVYAGTPNSDNEWILELSDASGSFSNPVELARESDNTTVKTRGFEFAIPTNTRGAAYELRVRSTSPASIGQPTSASYSFYYMDFTSALAISKDGNGVIGDVCSSTNSVRLEVHNLPSPETYQYEWYRSGSLLPTKTHFIEATQDGYYTVRINYGQCSGSGTTDSNATQVTLNASGQGIAISAPSKTGLCSGESESLSIDTTDSAWSYQWYKNDTAIPGAVATTYTVNGANMNFDGDYQIEISGTGICTERTPAVTITNAGVFNVTRNNSANLVVLPSDSETLSITTDANSPTYQWYRNSTAIPSSNSNSLTVSQAGTYYAKVTSSGSCSSTITSETTEVVSPSAFRFEIDYATAYESCKSSSIVLEVDKIYAELSDSSEIDVTADVATNFTYQWKKDGTDLSGENAQSISLTSNNENGNYTIKGVSGSFNATSNALPVQLGSSKSTTITSTSTVYCNASDTITLNTDTDLAGETYTWERDGVSVNSTDSALTVTKPGTYRLVIQKGICPLTSNEITITPLDPDLITLNIEGDVVFPEGSSKTITASGGSAYRWFDAGNAEIATGASVTFTEEGSYLLIANLDNCEVSKPIKVTYLDQFNIPNVITPNGDGSNDQWVVPNSYSGKSDVRIIIYNAKGAEVLNTANYQNNWPESSTSFSKQNMVFYYVIKNATTTLKQGTITVIR
ncbi:gliding motility-associated C-terminal domain-containing protein [Pricia antarctica]|uniref:Gliding motility-associated C-terminal domain-containing protein n=1 Tax=Pricia antarctica TaxID=641691 RepID=A0A1G6X7K8_9FLAO|nr:gliding motility-associated C-terminal domain-containing protein [Pricia antarctica]SDD73315.1 gliding motility-associated C-terminal domain-containing protein [Pricia antarctica]